MSKSIVYRQPFLNSLLNVSLRVSHADAQHVFNFLEHHAYHGERLQWRPINKVKSDAVKKSFKYFHVEVEKEKYAKNAKSVNYFYDLIDVGDSRHNRPIVNSCYCRPINNRNRETNVFQLRVVLVQVGPYLYFWQVILCEMFWWTFTASPQLLRCTSRLCFGSSPLFIIYYSAELTHFFIRT